MPLVASLLLANFDARQSVIDAVPHPIFIKDADSRFVAVNPAMCSLMRQEADALIGRNDYDFVPGEQADIFRAKDLLVLQTGEPNENEELLSDPSGGRIRTIITRKHRVLVRGGGQFIIGCISDITDLREHERQHRAGGRNVSAGQVSNVLLFERALEEARAAAIQFALNCIGNASFTAKVYETRERAGS